jgi:hypothetical protein
MDVEKFTAALMCRFCGKVYAKSIYPLACFFLVVIFALEFLYETSKLVGFDIEIIRLVIATEETKTINQWRN